MSGELEQSSVLSILETTAADGKVYSTQWYHLDAVIAVNISRISDWLRKYRQSPRNLSGCQESQRCPGRLADGRRKLCMSIRLQQSTELSHRCGDAAIALCQLRPRER